MCPPPGGVSEEEDWPDKGGFQIIGFKREKEESVVMKIQPYEGCLDNPRAEQSWRVVSGARNKRGPLMLQIAGLVLKEKKGQ